MSPDQVVLVAGAALLPPNIRLKLAKALWIARCARSYLVPSQLKRGVRQQQLPTYGEVTQGRIPR